MRAPACASATNRNTGVPASLAGQVGLSWRGRPIKWLAVMVEREAIPCAKSLFVSSGSEPAADPTDNDASAIEERDEYKPDCKRDHQ